MSNSISAATVSTTKRGHTLVLTISGPLAAGGGDMLFRAALADALEAGERQFVLDFSALGTLDSSGLGELVRAATEVERRGGLMAWVRCPRPMLDVLTITDVRLNGVVFNNSVEGGLAAFKRPA